MPADGDSDSWKSWLPGPPRHGRMVSPRAWPVDSPLTTPGDLDSITGCEGSTTVSLGETGSDVHVGPED